MGTLLFLLGLLTGFGIPSFRSPRIGLSAHLAAIESGLGLIAFGLLLPHLAIATAWTEAIGASLWISLGSAGAIVALLAQWRWSA
jgi:hydroxylaminobenzene mutase